MITPKYDPEYEDIELRWPVDNTADAKKKDAIKEQLAQLHQKVEC
ncbi:MAG: hypothetical protein R2793_09560 [Flavobacteriaceae bacterium]